MRDRGWRRYKQELVIKKRLNKHTFSSSYYFRFKDCNNVSYQHTTISNYIGGNLHHMYKTYTTDKNTTRHKYKYSPNKTKYYRDNVKGGLRENEKRVFLNILKEYGIR